MNLSMISMKVGNMGWIGVDSVCMGCRVLLI